MQIPVDRSSTVSPEPNTLSTMTLTHGAVAQMSKNQGHASNPAFQPVVQLISVKPVASNANGERYRAIISDGQHFVQGMLASQLNNLVNANQLKENSIVQVEDYMNNQVSNRTVIILLRVTVTHPDFGSRIGQPTDVQDLKAASAVTPSDSASAQPMYNRTNVTSAAPSYAKPDTGNPYGGAASASAPIVRSAPTASGVPTTPIAALNMYQNRWTIRARVTSKSDIRTWSNAKGEGSLFSVELLDASGVDIRATLFKEAVDKFYPMLQVDKVYLLSGGRLKVANMQYNTCKSNFEITFDQNSMIQQDNDTGEVPQQLYDFSKIATLERVEPGQMVDVLGVVKTVGEPASLVSKKSGQELTKCDLTLVDDSGVEINLTVWGDKAQKAPTDFTNTPVVAFRRARVSDYGGRSLSATANGAIVKEPPIPETQALKQWWSASGGQGVRSLSSAGGSGGGAGSIPDLENRKYIADIKGEQLGYAHDKPDYIAFKGTIGFLKKDKDGGAWYTACANAGEPCKNRYKATQTTDGNWYCDKCQGTFPNCVRRWIFSGTVYDDTSTTWVSFFNEQAEALFNGAIADDVFNSTMNENMDQDKYDSYFIRATNTDWVFKCKVKQEMVGEETRVKTSVVAMAPVDYAKESLDLLTEIAKC